MFSTPYVTTNKWLQPEADIDTTMCIFNSTDRICSAKDEGKTIQIWDLATGELLKTIEEVKKEEPLTKSIQCIRMYEDKIAIGTRDGYVIIRNSNGDLLKKFKVGEEYIDLIVSENEILYVFTLSKIYLYDALTENFEKLLEVTPPYNVMDTHFQKGKMYFIDKSRIQITSFFPNKSSQFLDVKDLIGSKCQITCIEVTDEKIFVAISGYNTGVKILVLDGSTYQMEKTLQGHRFKITKLESRNQKLISHSCDFVRVWDDNYKCIFELFNDCYWKPMNSIYFEGKLFYLLWDEMQVFDLTNGESNIFGSASAHAIKSCLILDEKIIVLRNYSGIEIWNIGASSTEFYKDMADLFTLFSTRSACFLTYRELIENFSIQPDDHIKDSIYREFGKLVDIDDKDMAISEFLNCPESLYLKQDACKIRAQAIRNALLEEEPQKSIQFHKKKRHCIII